MKITCGIFLYSTKIGKILACHATKAPAASWSIPKGLKDGDEEELAAALRELYEETGIDLRTATDLRVQRLREARYAKQNKVLVPFLIISDEDFSGRRLVCHTLVKNTFPEIDKWKWISLEETKILHQTQQELIPDIRKLVEGK
jgi:predicted NUDIX family NTP pyrophosphohydrolase